jgi:hypothetical protein
VTLRSTVITTVHVVVLPAQVPPLHPVKRLPLAGTAVRVTDVPVGYAFEHVVPQLIPDGREDTEPEPIFVTDRVLGTAVKVAVTVFATFISTMQPPVPAQGPDQPPNVWPTDGVAIRETSVPASSVAEHVDPQLIQAGLEVTVPEPLPALVTVNL